MLLTIALDAPEIGMEELLPQKQEHKSNFDCTRTDKKTYCAWTLKLALNTW